MIMITYLQRPNLRWKLQLQPSQSETNDQEAEKMKSRNKGVRQFPKKDILVDGN